MLKLIRLPAGTGDPYLLGISSVAIFFVESSVLMRPTSHAKARNTQSAYKPGKGMLATKTIIIAMITIAVFLLSIKTPLKIIDKITSFQPLIF